MKAFASNEIKVLNILLNKMAAQENEDLIGLILRNTGDTILNDNERAEFIKKLNTEKNYPVSCSCCGAVVLKDQALAKTDGWITTFFCSLKEKNKE